MTKLERIEAKIKQISIIFDAEYVMLTDILHTGDFSVLNRAIDRRKSTAKAIRCLLKMLDIEKEKAVNLS